MKWSGIAWFSAATVFAFGILWWACWAVLSLRGWTGIALTKTGTYALAGLSVFCARRGWLHIHCSGPHSGA